MRKLLIALAVVLIVMPIAGALAQDNPDAILGEWLTEKKDAGITIYKCGAEYCAKITWLKEPNEPDGTPKLDKKNKNEAERGRPLMGLQLMHSLKYDKGNKWKDGKIYAADDGKYYRCDMALVSANELDVRGSVLGGLIGRTTRWTRK